MEPAFVSFMKEGPDDDLGEWTATPVVPCIDDIVEINGSMWLVLAKVAAP